MAAAVFLNGEG